MKKTDYNKYEDKIKDVDEVIGTDVKINPDYYIHIAITMAQKALSEKDFIRYSLHIEDLERLCKAAKILTDNYEDELKKFKTEDHYKKAKTDDIKNFRLADKKKSLLLKEIFDSKTVTGVLKI